MVTFGRFGGDDSSDCGGSESIDLDGEWDGAGPSDSIGSETEISGSDCTGGVGTKSAGGGCSCGVFADGKGSENAGEEDEGNGSSEDETNLRGCRCDGVVPDLPSPDFC